MPARRAMSSVDVPTYPPSANSTSAASSTVSRRSAALMRVVVISGTRRRLVMTHKLVKSLPDPVLLGLGQPLVQRERERALERRIGAGERPLVAVGAEAMEPVRADLALDALCPELRHHLVAPVELDHVGLPAVHVALVGARQRDVEV